MHQSDILPVGWYNNPDLQHTLENDLPSPKDNLPKAVTRHYMLNITQLLASYL